VCGIVGVYDHGRTEGHVDEATLVDMRETIHHRGPDEAGSWVSEDARVGLAMRRLSILDIDGGTQPMFGAGGEVLVFNGEIYNYPELRRELAADGVRFETHCDTEVILHLYARHGIDCLARLNGMFAFALWDPREQRLFLARDRVGEKPLYWADVGGTLVFGSEIKALLAHPAVTPAVNESAIGPYLTNLVTTAPETLYAGIQKLPPGTLAICGPDGPQVRPYWQLFEPRAWNDVGLEEAAAHVRELLDRSVHQRLLSDVPVGVLLSGGLDSTTLVALLREQAAGFATFSVGYDDSPTDERAEARRVARHYGTDHHEVVVGERDAIEFLPTLVHHQDEPLADPVCLPLHFVCALARRHGVKVVLAGEGSDEMFWGYTAYQRILERERWLRGILRLPGPVRRRLPGLVPGGRWANHRELLAGLADGRPNPMHMPLGLTREYRSRVLRDRREASSTGWIPSDGSANGRADPVERLAFDTQEYEFGLRLPELLLMRIDRFSMANGVEARVPFLDPELVDYVYRLPPSLKLADGVSKTVLKAAIGDIVPPWVINRPKQGFDAPVLSWLGAGMGRLLGELLDDEAIGRYFDVAALTAALGRTDERSRDNFGLWPILNFALWHRHWIAGEPLDDVVSAVSARV
jgi:asparagine synthase (glutamine-hydrolysing)